MESEIEILEENSTELTVANEKWVVMSKQNVPVTTSFIVAEIFGKRHNNVVRDIKNVISQLLANHH